MHSAIEGSPGFKPSCRRPADRFRGLHLESLPSPCYVLDLAQLRANGRILTRIQEEGDCKILLALKAFATWQVFPELRPYLAGTCASGLHEARLGAEAFGGELHVFAPAFKEGDLAEILEIAGHVTFNSLSQWQAGRPLVENHPGRVRCGLRLNPQCSVAETPLYDPSAPHSHLGLLAAELPAELPEGITGLHFHNLSEQTLEPLQRTLQQVERDFGHLLHQCEWLNLGGGHLLTRPDYELDELLSILHRLRSTYHVDLYLEPGEAVVWNAGLFVASVLDVLERGEESTAITDASATCHLPDVLEMPYRPRLWDSAEPGQGPFTYRIGGNTCLAGDCLGDFSFAHPLSPGQRLAFDNEAMYTMVKNTAFNGLPLPSITTWDSDLGELKILREFGYQDYRSRLS